MLPLCWTHDYVKNKSSELHTTQEGKSATSVLHFTSVYFIFTSLVLLTYFHFNSFVFLYYCHVISSLLLFWLYFILMILSYYFHYIIIELQFYFRFTPIILQILLKYIDQVALPLLTPWQYLTYCTDSYDEIFIFIKNYKQRLELSNI